MGSDQKNSSPSPNGKRGRDPEDEVYVDNLHSHKRYLSEIMASSLNGLTVGDTLTDNLLDSPARDEMPWQYSPMSEDSDESRYCEGVTQPESLPTSPVSPCRYQKQFNAFAPGASFSAAAPCSQSRQRGSDSDGRFPSSPSDICHSADLRRAALLRSVQIRTQCPGASSSVEQPYGPEPEPEGRPFSLTKEDMVQECSSSTGDFETILSKEKPRRALNMSMKDGDEAAD
uniref:Uncharacterized protein n=1 Tax=Kalanchoe fedtschenkoi TaxID=63787 RepID=A0A7N0SVF2_KALFE